MAKSARSFALLLLISATAGAGLTQDKISLDSDAVEEPESSAPSALATGQSAPPEKPKIKHLGGDEYRIGNIRFNQESKEIVLSGKVNMKVGYLEYVIVNELTGKIHESLLSTSASPMDLNIALLLLGYEPSDAIANQQEDKAVPPVEKASFDVSVRWTAKDKKKREEPIEHWIHNLATESQAKEGPWLYSGSKTNDTGNFAAEMDGSILAIYRDPRSLANNPREGKLSDEIWKPSVDVPEKETFVEIVIRPHILAKKPGGAAAKRATK